jgi:transcription antitermination factor NusG
MIQLGSKVRVVRTGWFDFRGEVVDVDPIRSEERSMVKVRPDPNQVTVVVAPGELDRWVWVTECVEEDDDRGR